MSETRNLMLMDKTAFSVASLSDESDEVTYRLTKTPQERLQGVELMRRVVYGYEPSSARFREFLKSLNSKQIEHLLIDGYAVGC